MYLQRYLLSVYTLRTCILPMLSMMLALHSSPKADTTQLQTHAAAPLFGPRLSASTLTLLSTILALDISPKDGIVLYVVASVPAG